MPSSPTLRGEGKKPPWVQRVRRRLPGHSILKGTTPSSTTSSSVTLPAANEVNETPSKIRIHRPRLDSSKPIVQSLKKPAIKVGKVFGLSKRAKAVGLESGHGLRNDSSSSSSSGPSPSVAEPSRVIERSGRIRRTLQSSSVVFKEVLNVVAQSSDAFPPLKSAVGGVLAVWSIKDRVQSCKSKAQILHDKILEILANADSSKFKEDELANLQACHLKLKTIMARRSVLLCLKHLSHDEEVLNQCQAKFDWFCQKSLLFRRDTSKLIDHPWSLFVVTLAFL